MTLRDATTNDAPAISALVSDLVRRHIAPSLTDAGLAKLLSSMNEEATRQRIEDGWPHLLKIVDNELAGLIVISPPTHLFHLFVHSSMQRTGVARRLFHAADERVRKNTGERIATVNSSLNAIDVYRRLGFEISGSMVENQGVRFQPMVRTGGSE